MSMFQTGELLKYNLTEQGRVVGVVSYNPRLNFKATYTRPFIRNKARVILSIGRVNYAALDEFIVASLTAYYQSINLAKKQEVKNSMVSEYQQLYYLWQTILNAKQNRDSNLPSYYDDLVYRLYLLGFKTISKETK